MAIYFLLVSAEFVYSILNIFERPDVSKVFFFELTVEQRCPVVDRQALYCKSQLQCSIRNCGTILTTLAYGEPRHALAQVMA
ncbi:hypothetical protein B0E47_08740 [Rhodanobacter sp. B05]|nr:hypothetical protein B0E47_08740 [Rhodanobacter sp. B05]